MVHEIHVKSNNAAASRADAGETACSEKKRAAESNDEAEDMKQSDDEHSKSHVNNKQAPANDDQNKKLSPRILPGPTIDGDSIDFPLSAIANHLICQLCQGYFRDPYTTQDCLHSFCRSCLIVHFRVGHRKCPTCNVSLEPDPFREVLADRTLQELVDKIFPWMKKKEEEEEKAFYEARGIKLKPEYETAESSAKKQKTDEEKSAKDAAMSKGFTSDAIDLQLVPYETSAGQTSLPPLQRPVIRTSGRLKIVSIKKYLVQRLGLKDTQSSIEILCNGDVVGNEHSLTFILRTCWFAPDKMLTLNYRLMEER